MQVRRVGIRLAALLFFLFPSLPFSDNIYTLLNPNPHTTSFPLPLPLSLHPHRLVGLSCAGITQEKQKQKSLFSIGRLSSATIKGNRAIDSDSSSFHAHKALVIIKMRVRVNRGEVKGREGKRNKGKVANDCRCCFGVVFCCWRRVCVCCCSCSCCE